MKKEITIVDNALFAEFKKDCKINESFGIRSNKNRLIRSTNP